MSYKYACYLGEGVLKGKEGESVETIIPDIPEMSDESITGDFAEKNDLQWKFDPTTGILVISGTDTVLEMDYTISWNGKHTKDGEVLAALPWVDGTISQNAIKEVIVAAPIEKVGNYMLAYFRAATKMTLPNTVKTLVNGALSYSDSLTTVVVAGNDAEEGVIDLSTVTTFDGYALDDAFKGESVVILTGDIESFSAAKFLQNCVAEIYIKPGTPLDEWATKYKNGDFVDKADIGQSITFTYYPNTESDFEYRVNPDGESVTVTKYIGFSGDVVIPSKIDGYSVTIIDDYALNYHNSITSVTIPDSVTSIGYSAFANCLNLESVIIGNGVEKILPQAFVWCSKLVNINIPDSVKSIGYYAFAGCSALENVMIGKNVTNIDAYAFGDCTSLESITIPSSVTLIDDLAFCGCSNLEAIEVDENNGMYCDIDGVLFTLDAKTLLIFPGGRSEIYSIPNGVTSVGKYAFYNCNNLAGIAISDSVMSIGALAFEHCSSLKELYVNDLESWLNVDLKSNYSHPLSSAGGKIYINNVLVTEITIPDTVSSIGDYAFVGCNNLTGVTIPKGITSIGEHAFDNCNKLKTIYLYKNSYADEYFGYSYTKKYLDVCTITYDLNGGNGIFEEQTKKSFEKVSLNSNIPTKKGYIFVNWKGSDGRIYFASDTCFADQDLVLTAVWQAKSVTLTYNACGGSVSSAAKTVKYEQTVGDLETPIKTGYTFVGWYSEEVDGEQITSSTIVDFLEGKTIYAHWNANSYSVSFNPNGGTTSYESKNVVFDSTYGTLPTPMLAGFVFDGWYTEFDGGTLVTSETIVETASKHTLYAHWSAAEYLVIFNANGGKCEIDSKTVSFGSKFGELPTPQRKGYKFVAWSKTKSLTGEVNAETVYQNTADTTLYAIWEKVNYGDANSDGEIDVKDVVLLVQHLAGWSASVDEALSDCNGDGKINIKDVVLLAQYLASWDVILG